jgi:hypothetical protein
MEEHLSPLNLSAETSIFTEESSENHSLWRRSSLSSREAKKM